MTVAIKLPLAYTAYRIAVKQYAGQDREAVVVSCVNCRQGYVLFFGPEMSESEAQQWFYYHAKRDHHTRLTDSRLGTRFRRQKNWLCEPHSISCSLATEPPLSKAFVAYLPIRFHPEEDEVHPPSLPPRVSSDSFFKALSGSGQFSAIFVGRARWITRGIPALLPRLSAASRALKIERFGSFSHDHDHATGRD